MIEKQMDAIMNIKQCIDQNGFLGRQDAEFLLGALTSYILENEKLWTQLNHAWATGGEYLEVKNDVQ